MQKKQNGRSMIEMLGVLAIIAVISIGSYTLYRRAVDTHKANSIFDDVNRFEFVISERVFRTPRGFFDKADFSPVSGFEMTAYNEPELASHYISVADVPKSVCQIVLNKGEKDYVMFANNLIFEGETDICNKDLNKMRFYFGDTSDLCSFPDTTLGQFACSDECLCDNDRVCKPDIYNPDSIPKMTEETVCCPDDDNIVACNGKCISSNCGTGKTLDRKTCQCVCTDSMKQMDENGNCVCKTSSSSVALVADSNGNCKCSDDRYIWIDSLNKCSFLNCPNGDGGNCNLDGVLCGYRCTDTKDITAITCQIGFCRADLCPSGQYFEKMPKEGNNSGYKWGCRLGDSLCYKTKSESYAYCFNDNSLIPHECCLSYSPDTCDKQGSCDPTICEQFKSQDANVKYGNATDQSVGGCLFSNGVKCYPTNADASKWTCFPSTGGNTACATNCTTPPNCGTCTDRCGGQGRADGDYCCVVHSITGETICRKGDYYYFKNGTTYDRCGATCTYTGLTKQNDGTYTATSISCWNGHCQAPTCTDSTWSYGKITGSSYWGCVKGNVNCYAAGGDGPYVCYGCGKRCSTIDNTDCMLWSRKQCAPMVTKNNVSKPACVYGRVQGTTNIDDYDYDCWCQGDVDSATNICCPTGQIVRSGACVVNQ